jgi:hypothetical protein
MYFSLVKIEMRGALNKSCRDLIYILYDSKVSTHSKKSKMSSSMLNPAAEAFVPATTEAFVPTTTDEFELVSSPIADPDKAALKYPFSYIAGSEDEGWCGDYDTADFTEGLLGEEKCDAGKFPDNIVEFYWLHEGHNDEDAWQLLCKLDNGNFAFYTAWCDYTGFDCQGGMKLIVSKDLKSLFYDGLTRIQRYQCLKDKKKPYKPVEKTYTSNLARARDAPSSDDEVDPDFPQMTLGEYAAGSGLPKARTPKPFKWEVPVVPVAKPAAEATRAFIRVWEDGKELILNLDNVNGLEMEALEYGIRGLTAQFLSPKGAKVSKKKFYNVNICCGTSVTGIDDYFKKRFGNPDKKWELRMKFSGTGMVRKWGKLEVSFILF